MAVPFSEPATDAVSVSIPVTRVTGDTEAEVVDALRRTVGSLGAARRLVGHATSPQGQ